jgi:peptide/nickel transport system permease protein
MTNTDLEPASLADPDLESREPSGAIGRRRRGPILTHFKTHPLSLAALFYVVALVIVAIFAPLFAPYAPTESDLTAILQPPSSDHLLGTDQLGRDVLSRIIYGARTSTYAATLAVSVAAVLGVPIGLLSGYRGRRVDLVFSRLNDALMSVPPLILALAVVAVLGPGLTNAMVAIGIISTPRFFRVVRAAAIDVRDSTFIEASKALGCTERRVVFAHILPNVMSPLLVAISVSFATAIVAEASLSFLGLGAVPPTASWGQMLAQATGRLDLKYLVYAPGIAITLAVMAFMILGDAIRDAIGMRREEDRG